MTISRDLARDQRGQWLLDLDFGRVYRFSTRDADVDLLDGSTVRYFSGLGDFTLGTSLGAEASVGFQIDAGVADRGEPINWAQQIPAGIDLEERPAVLRRWFPGQKLEDARVWLRGTTINARYGDPSAHVGRLTISIERRPTKGVTVPGPQERVDDPETWPSRVGPTVDPTVLGATYPLVVGAPGTIAGGSFGAPVTPALFVESAAIGDDDRLLISTGPVEAIAVRLYDQSSTPVPGASETRTVKTMVDALGRTISYVDFIGSALTATFGNKYYIGWLADNAVAFGGGALNPRTGNLLRDAVDVITFFLERNGTLTDFARMDSQRSLLNVYKFDTVINTPTVAFEFLRSQVLPLLPVVERQGELGLYYEFRSWNARREDVVITLDADRRQVDRTSPIVRRRQAELYNEFTIEYGPHLVTNRYTRRRVLTAQPQFISGPRAVAVTDVRILGDLRCALSQSRFGLRPAPPIKARSVWDDVTAEKILRERAARDALPKRVTQYTGGRDLEWLQDHEGAICRIVDTEGGMPDDIARIDNVTVGDGQTVIDITTLDDPVQLARATG